LNEIQKEINDKNGKQLHIAKITDGFYKLGKDRIIKLAYDEQAQRILSKYYVFINSLQSKFQLKK
jgi:hypothetical protein